MMGSEVETLQGNIVADDRNFYPELDLPPPPRQKDQQTINNDSGPGFHPELDPPPPSRNWQRNY